MSIKRLQDHKCLPERKWYAPESLTVTVNPASAILVNKGIYSVPSRLIGYTLTADIFSKQIEVRYGRRLIQTMPRLTQDEGALINYRHVVGYLLRKPGAFLNYQYRECLFPRVIFRKAYDTLIEESSSRGVKNYLQVLHLAAIGCESEVATALEILSESRQVPLPENVKELLDIPFSAPPLVNIDLPQLSAYDSLLSNIVGET